MKMPTKSLHVSDYFSDFPCDSFLKTHLTFFEYKKIKVIFYLHTKYTMPRIYNYKPQKLDERDMKLDYDEIELPSSFDIRDVLGVPIVFNQGSVGSCSANSSALVYMYTLNKEKLAEFTPSRLFIYANSRLYEGVALTDDAGSDLRDVMKTIQIKHVCTEKVWPYIESKFSVKPPSYAYAAAMLHKEFNYMAVAQTETAIKTALLNHHAIAFGITLFLEFESEEVAKTGIVPMPNEDETPIGGHAITIVSYDDEKQAFGVQNSWGRGWGVNSEGWCWFPYAYVLNPDLATDFWVIKTCNE